MEKAARCILKLVAVGLVVGAAVCAVITYWDRIVDAFYDIAERMEEKRARLRDSEYDDYVDESEWVEDSFPTL